MKYIVILLIAFLTACGSTPKLEKEYVTKTESVVVQTPSDLLRPCDVTKPYDANDFINLKTLAKENILTNLIIDLYGDLKVCNDKIKAIKEHQLKSLSIVKDNKQ